MIHHPRELDRPHLVREGFGALGAGADIAWTPNVRTHVELLSLRIAFTTDATVANRLMVPIIGPVGNDDFAFPCPVAQIATRSYEYYWGRDVGCFWTANFANYWEGPLPSGLLFSYPEQLRTGIVNIQAGDQITGYTIRYQLWQDPVAL